MCLNIEKDELLTAGEDLECWKVVRIKEGRLKSFYKYFDYVPNHLYEEPNSLEVNTLFGGVMVIDNGFHSYVHKEDAHREWLESSFVRIVRCVIPKGAQYREGHKGDNEANYCSNKIIIKEVVCV